MAAPLRPISAQFVNLPRLVAQGGVRGALRPFSLRFSVSQVFRPPCPLCQIFAVSILTHRRPKGYRPIVPTPSASPPHTSNPADTRTPPPKMPPGQSASRSGLAAQAESTLSHAVRTPHGKSRKPCATPPARPET